MLSGGLCRRWQRQPAVAAKAAIPAQTIVCPGNQRVLGTELLGIGSDQLMPLDTADQQLPVELRAKARGLRDARRRTMAPCGLRCSHIRTIRQTGANDYMFACGPH